MMKKILEILASALAIILMIVVLASMKPKTSNWYLVDDRHHADDCFELYDDYELIGYFCPSDGYLDVYYFQPQN